jgi:hypothetical protein
MTPQTPDMQAVLERLENLERRNRRLTRLTNAFSREWENPRAALALHFAYFNFCRAHGALGVTLATEGGLADHVWTIRRRLRQSADNLIQGDTYGI